MPLTITFFEPLTSSQITDLMHIVQATDTGNGCTFICHTPTDPTELHTCLTTFTAHHCFSARLENETEANIEYFGIGADLLQSSHALGKILLLIPDLVPVDADRLIAALEGCVSEG